MLKKLAETAPQINEVTLWGFRKVVIFD